MRQGAEAARASADGYAGFVPGGKDVTRRLGWHWASPGTFVLAVSKCMGLRPGEVAEVFGVIEVLAVSRGPLSPITQREVDREGFARVWSPSTFVEKFLRISGGGDPYELAVTRVVFRHVDPLRISAAWAALTPSQRHAFTDRERAA